MKSELGVMRILNADEVIEAVRNMVYHRAIAQEAILSGESDIARQFNEIAQEERWSVLVSIGYNHDKMMYILESLAQKAD